MSEIGLQSGLYSQLCDYADDLNELLVELKSRPANAVPPVAPPLTQFVEHLHDGTAHDLAARRLSRRLRWARITKDQLGSLARALKAGVSYPELIPDLELLATELRRQQAGAYARLRRP